jgi:hypothetical protein
VTKERKRAVFHSLPIKAIPKIVIKCLAMECTKKLHISHKKEEFPSILAPERSYINKNRTTIIIAQ